jgi:dGTPase
MEAADRDIKRFLFARMYRHPEVERVREKADAIVRGLFAAYLAAPEAMPREWTVRAGDGEGARAAADYIAGMTDRFALSEYRRLFDPDANLR